MYIGFFYLIHFSGAKQHRLNWQNVLLMYMQSMALL